MNTLRIGKFAGGRVLPAVVSGAMVLFSLLAFTRPALANDPVGGQLEQVTGATRVTMAFDGGHATRGLNGVTVNLRDSTGVALESDTVKVTLRMDPSANMGSHSMLNLDPRTVEMGRGMARGEYTGRVEFTDPGMWLVTASFDLSGKESEVTFDVDIAGGGPNWLILGGLGGAMALVIIVAAVARKRKSRDLAS